MKPLQKWNTKQELIKQLGFENIKFEFGLFLIQSVCLDDKHQPQPKYDFLKDGTSPGEKYNALAQCQLAFGNEFKPHLRDEIPFEVKIVFFSIVLL
jgi:hypothetical protein